MSDLFKNTAIISLLIFSSALFADTPANKPSAGFVASVDGSAYIIRGNRKILISAMDILRTSDQVILPSGAHIRINLLPDSGYEISGAAQFTIGKNLSFTKGKIGKSIKISKSECSAALKLLEENADQISDLSVEGKTNSVKLSARKGERSGVYRIRGAKGKEYVVLYKTDLLPVKPLLFWNHIENSARYTIELRSGEETFLSVESVEPSFEYPVDAPSLKDKPGLVATIKAFDKSDTLIGSGVAELSMLDQKISDEYSQKELAILSSKDEKIKQILLARLYESYDLIPLAIAAYEYAAAENDKDDGLQKRIKLLKEKYR
jgi:hypothetical protein